MTERRWGEPWMNEPGGVSDEEWEGLMRQRQAQTPCYRVEPDYSLRPSWMMFNPSLAHAEYMASAMRPMVWPWEKTATMTDEQAFEELGEVMVAEFPWKLMATRVEGAWEWLGAENGLWWRK